MLLPEMTSSARVARAFLRFARGAVVGLALGGLGGLLTSAAAEDTEDRRTYGPCGVSGKEAGDRANELFAEFDRRIAPDSEGRVPSARARVCHQLNVLRVTRWVNEVCLLHGPLTPTEKSQVREQIAIYDVQIADLRRTDGQLGAAGAAPCACWWATACPDL